MRLPKVTSEDLPHPLSQATVQRLLNLALEVLNGFQDKDTPLVFDILYDLDFLE